MNYRALGFIALLIIGAYWLGANRSTDDRRPTEQPIDVIAETAVRTEAVLRADAYRDVGNMLEAGTLTTEADAHAALKEKISEARRAAWAKLDERIEVDTAGEWQSGKAARLFYKIESGLRRVR